MRRATEFAENEVEAHEISIHALLAESDHQSRGVSHQTEHFYPRSPCGERLMDTLILANAVLFLSTLSLRRATRFHAADISASRISIHALLAESDDTSKDIIKARRNFYPRSPCGERLDKRCQFNGDNGFLSTLSLRRATSDKWQFKRYINISIHALLAESDTILKVYGYGDNKFLSTLSLRRATSKT